VRRGPAASAPSFILQTATKHFHACDKTSVTGWEGPVRGIRLGQLQNSAAPSIGPLIFKGQWATIELSTKAFRVLLASVEPKGIAHQLGDSQEVAKKQVSHI